MHNSKDTNLLDSLDSPSSQSQDVIHVEPDGEAEEPLLEQAENQVIQDAAAEEQHNVPFGMLCYAISSFFFAMMAVVVKLAGKQGLPTWEIIFCRSAVVMALTLPQVLAAGKNPFGNRRWLLSFRGFTGFVSNSSLFFAVQLIPIADMAVFTFLTPIFVALASPFALKERLAPGSLLTCGLCMLGVILVAQPPILFGEGRLTLAAVAIGLLHPVMSACAKASIRILTKTEINLVMVFYLSLFTLVGSFLGMVLIPGQLQPITSVYEAILLLAAGLCGFGTQMFMNMGLRRVKAAQAMTMSYLGIVWSGVAGVLVFREYPNLYSGIGDGVIILATLLFALRSAGVFRRKARNRSVSLDSPLDNPLLPATPAAQDSSRDHRIEEAKTPIIRVEN